MSEQVKMLSMAEILEGQYAVRTGEEDDSISELASSISRVGMLNPIMVRREGDSYIVIAGHRRLAAAKLAGLVSVPVVVRSSEESEAREVSLAENIFRKDLSPIEQAGAIKDFMASCDVTVQQVAQAMSRGVKWVEFQLSILDWPADVVAKIHAGFISVSAARNLAMIEDTGYRRVLLNTAMESGATARTTAAWLQAWRAAKPASEAAAAEPVSPGSTPSSVASYLICAGCRQEFEPGKIPFVPLCSTCGGILRQAYEQAPPGPRGG